MNKFNSVLKKISPNNKIRKPFETRMWFLLICFILPKSSLAQNEIWYSLGKPTQEEIVQIIDHPKGFVYVRTKAGEIFRQNQSDNVWRLVYSHPGYLICDIAIAYSNGQIFISAIQSAEDAFIIIRSKDDGNTWTEEINTEWVDSISSSLGKISIDENTGRLYWINGQQLDYTIITENILKHYHLALVELNYNAVDIKAHSAAIFYMEWGTSDNCDTFFIYDLTNSTNTWYDMPTCWARYQIEFDDKRSTVYTIGNYGSQITINKGSNNGKVWTKSILPVSGTSTLAVNSYDGNIYVGTNGNGILVSSDSGQSWSFVNNGLIDKNIIKLSSDIHNNQIYAATSDGLVYKLGQQSGSLGSPSLLYPYSSNNQTWHTINMHWTSVTGADTYSLQVSRNSSFTDLVLNQSGLTSNYYLASFDRNRTYYWRVKAKQGSSVSSDWSDIWSFTTDYTSQISNLAPYKYEVAKLSSNKFYYTDREFVITSLPIELNDLLWIKTINTDDKSATSESFLSFSLSQAATIYVCYDSRGTAQPPNWLKNNFLKQSGTLGVSDKSNPMSVWKKSFSPGQVILGGNLAAGAAGAGSNYIVAIKFEANISPIISGRVTLSNGTGVDGVTLTFSNGGGTATTSGGGYYSKTVPYGWTGTVTLHYDGYSFYPDGHSYTTPVYQDLPNENYTALPPPNIEISGRVTLFNGSGLDGVSVYAYYETITATSTTSNGGFYQLSVPYEWKGFVGAEFSDYKFSPNNIFYTELGHDTTEQNFTAMQCNNLHWQQIKSTPTQFSCTSLVVDRDDRIYLGGENGLVYRSSDNGNSWTQIANGLTGHTIGTLATDKLNNLFLHNSTDGLFKSSDNGNSWQRIVTEMQGMWITAFAYNTKNHLFAIAGGNKLFRSLNNGNSWVELKTNLTELTALAINASDYVFLGTGSGRISSSTDNGLSWQDISNGLDDIAITTIACHPSGAIFAGTRGKGVYRTTTSGNSWNFAGLKNDYVMDISFNSAGHIFVGISAESSDDADGIYCSTDNGATWICTGLDDTYLTHDVAISASGFVYTWVSPPGVFRTKESTAPIIDPEISGKVMLANGTGLAGVSISFTGGLGTVLTGSDGSYAKSVPFGWAGTITPNYDSYTFNQSNITFSQPVIENKQNQDFLATPPVDRIISGRVILANGQGLNGVTLSFTNSAGTVVTSNNGNYSKQVKYGWKGSITPEYGSFTFIPKIIPVFNPVTQDTAVANIVAAPPVSILIAGDVFIQATGAGLNGVDMVFNDGVTITTANNGKYIREVPYGWSGNVKPQLKGYLFIPEYIQYPSLKRDTLNQNYLAAMHPNPEISGQVALQDGTGLAGVLITFSGGIGTVTTDALGNFKMSVPYGWAGVLTPSLDNYAFEPKTITCPELKNDFTNQFFKAVPMEIPTVTLKVKAPYYDNSNNFEWFIDRSPIDINRFAFEITLTKRQGDPPLKNIDLKAYISGKQLKINFCGLRENYDSNGDELIDSIPAQKSFDNLILLATSEAYSVNQLNKELVVQVKSINGISTDIKYVDNVSLYFAKNKYNHPFSLREDAYKFPNDKLGLSIGEVAYYLALASINPLLSTPITPLLYALSNSGGKCFGFSVTSGAYFLDENRKPVLGDVVTWEPTELAVLDHINEAQLSQCIWYNNLYNSLEWEASSTYNKLIESFKDYYPTVIGMESNSGGHAILAISVIEFDKKGESYIGVYDPNRPGESYTVRLDRFKNIFSYYNPDSYLKFTAIPQSNYSIFALDALLNQFYSKLTDQMTSNNLKGYAAGCPVFLMLSNSYGQKLGYDKDGILHKEFEGSVLRAPTNSAVNDSITIIYVSKNINCSVQINAFDEAKMSYEKFSASDDSCFTLYSLDNYQVTKDMVVYNDDSHPNLISIDRTGDGQIDYNFIINPNTSSVKDLRTSRKDLAPILLSNYPNPFNSTTMVSYYLSDDEFIELNVYDLQGRHVKRLANEFQGKGIHEKIWDGTNETNEQVCSGCYIIKLNHTNISLNRQVEFKRVMLIK